jgi:hypothetical protein
MFLFFNYPNHHQFEISKNIQGISDRDNNWQSVHEAEDRFSSDRVFLGRPYT